MPQQGDKPASKSSERKISARRFKDLRKDTSRIERRLSTLLTRGNEVDIHIGSSNGQGCTSFVMEKEYIDSEVGDLNATIARKAKTHSDYLAKNQRIDQERLGLE